MIKKTLCGLLVLSIFLLVGCGGVATPTSGTYSATDGTVATLELNQDTKEFTFYYLSYMSTIPMGTYTCEDGRLIATVSADEVYVFNIVDSRTLSFSASESSGYASHIWDGTILKLNITQ